MLISRYLFLYHISYTIRTLFCLQMILGLLPLHMCLHRMCTTELKPDFKNIIYESLKTVSFSGRGVSRWSMASVISCDIFELHVFVTMCYICLIFSLFIFFLFTGWPGQIMIPICYSAHSYNFLWNETYDLHLYVFFLLLWIRFSFYVKNNINPFSWRSTLQNSSQQLFWYIA